MTDDKRLRDLRRMKLVATGVLVAALVVWLVAWRAESSGAPTWVGFVRAGAEAAMIGGLADWFAVTALFRHPLGIPIPHTAIIPKRKEALGENLREFVSSNFLNEDVVRVRIQRAEVAGRVGSWLAVPANAERVTAELASAVRGALQVLSDADVQELLEDTVVSRLGTFEVGPPLGRVLDEVLVDGAHRGTVDLLAEHTRLWLVEHPREVIEAVAAASPQWSPRMVDEAIGARVHAELIRVASDVSTDPNHPLRGTIDAALTQFAYRLQHDPEMIARAQAAKDRLLDHPSTRAAMADMAAAARRMVLEAVDDPTSGLRLRVVEAIRSAGQRLVDDPEWRGKADLWVENLAAHVVANYSDELTRTITDTVERWDGEETSRRIEIAAGRDLQFIRINGAVVGALVGVLIHAFSLLMG
ncbi:MAG: DUF445 domain-containing protein [Actinomycetes bacterium]